VAFGEIYAARLLSLPLFLEMPVLNFLLVKIFLADVIKFVLLPKPVRLNPPLVGYYPELLVLLLFIFECLTKIIIKYINVFLL
jgi:hypothetical protein